MIQLMLSADDIHRSWRIQVTQSLPDIAFLNCRPSVIAAAIVYAERRSRGIIPFWPSMLSKLSAYQVAFSASSLWLPPNMRSLSFLSNVPVDHHPRLS